MQNRRDIDKAIKNLMKWIGDSSWSEELQAVFDAHFAPVCEHFGMSQDELAQELAEHDYTDMIFGIVFEDFISRRWEDDRNIIDDYLKHRGWRESVHGRRYLQQLRDSVLSLYEVIDVSPGHHCDIRDLVRGGERQRVYEHMGTVNLVKWDRIAARVLPGNGKRMFSGGLLMFRLDTAGKLLQALETTRHEPNEGLGPGDGGEPTGRALVSRMLEASCDLFTRIWLVETLERLRAPLPELTNRDGEDLIYTETRFALDAQHRDEAVERLESTPEWRRTDGAVWNWLPERDNDGESPRQGMSVDSFGEDHEAIHGMLELRPEELLFTANSMQRTERGTEILAALLEGLVGPPLTETETLEEVLEAELPESADEDEAADSIDELLEAERVMGEFMEEHYRRCIEEPVPALDGQTPRQCASSGAAGQEKVVEWLKYLENHELRRAAEALTEAYDFEWIWDELGLTRYRR